LNPVVLMKCETEVFSLHFACSDRQSETSFCDVVIAVGGQEIKAHKNVLAMCSDFFADMFLEEVSDIFIVDTFF